MIAAFAATALGLAYRIYGRFLAGRVFTLGDDEPVPSVVHADGSDFVATRRGVVFGHHFTSIAGTGPIVGPALAVIWGWLPALVWIVVGSITIGAVHDFGSLVVSMRKDGRTVGDVAGDVLGPRVRRLFLIVLVVALTIVLAIFGLVIAAVLRQYPAAITPCLLQIPIAVVIGTWLHRRGASLTAASLIALGLMYAGVLLGDVGPLGWFNQTMASLPTMAWVAGLLAYAYVASVLPVWVLLQPRDYINSMQLLTSLALVVVGLIVAAAAGGVVDGGEGRVPLEMAVPAVRSVADAPPLLPFLFVTIACGACSGFHCLVSSGTTSKQLSCARDALPIGYGSMLIEGALAVVVLLACGAGISLGTTLADGTTLVGAEAFEGRYPSWSGASGLGTKVAAFVDGSAGFLRSVGVPTSVGVALMGVLVASFAATTLDTSCRLQRYVVQELAADLAGPGSWLTGKHAATVVAVVVAFVMAVLPPPGFDGPGMMESLTAGGVAGLGAWMAEHGGRGGMILWPLFGATNQLLAGMALLVVTYYLRRTGRRAAVVAVPAAFMLAMTGWSMIVLVGGWIFGDRPAPILATLGVSTLVLEIWMIVEAVRQWREAAGRDVPGTPRDVPGEPAIQ